MKISIVIPAYNEEKRIGKTLEEYERFFESNRKATSLDYKILVVINNTKDRTEEIVKRFSNKNRRISYLNLIEGGKGFAIIEGFKQELKEDKSDFIGFVDADMATKPEDFYELFKNIKNYSGIIASRYVKGSKVSPKQTIQRIFVSRVFNFIIRTLFFFEYKDTQCGAKLFRKEALKLIINELIITKWAFDVDLIYRIKKRKLKLKEHPTIWADREYSKINFMKAGPRMGLAIIRLRLINSKLNFIVRGYDLLPNWIKVYSKLI